MSKVLKIVAVVAGVVAVLATGGAALAGAGTFLGATAGTLSAVAAIASVVSLAASFGSQLLTKPPPARGSVNQLLIQVDPPQPYAMGRTYFGGVLRHTAAYGPTLKDVPNPYLGRVVVYSGGGPIQGFVAPTTDFQPLGAYYSGFLDVDQQLGACPETTALTPFWSGFPNWGAANKLSGQAAMLWNFKFDKDGKKFASGLPNTGAIMDGVKTYDPRLDSTYPGGTGAHRINNETTWQFSKNPALHAIAYAYGRYQNGKKTFGIGLPVEAIDLEAMVAWANVCEANDWTISGIIFEPDDRWKNLKDIMAAGGAEPVFSGAVLSVKYHAPRVSLDTITKADLTDQGGTITAMRSYRERINTIVPKWRSEAHNWEYTAGAPIVLSTALTDDGEEKKEERQYNLVDNADQSAQLAAYELLERRELGTIELSCGPRLRQYRPGECLNIDLPEEGLSNVQAVILRRVIEPGSMTVRLVLLGETAEKHDYALGRTAVPPPTATLTQTAEQRDDLAFAADGVVAAYNLALSKGKVWTTSTMPSVAQSNVGDTWIGPDGTFYERVESAGILLDGFAISLGGFRPQLAWTLSQNQILRDTLSLADLAYESANDAIDQLIGLADDNFLSKNEKITKLIPENARLADKWSALSAAATSLAVSTTAANSARLAWVGFLGGLFPLWNDTTKDTPVSRVAFNTARDNYDLALYELDRSVKEKAATVSTWAGVSGAGRPADNATVGAPGGTMVGSISAGDVSSTINSGGGVAPNQVATSSIQNSAVTGASAVSASSAISLPSVTGNTVTLLSLSVTPTTSGTVYVALSADMSNQNTSLWYNAQFQILINGTVVFTSENMLMNPSGTSGSTGVWAYSGLFPVNIGAANTIVLRVLAADGYGNTQARVVNRSIFALELKK